MDKRPLFQKLWDLHAIRDMGEDNYLIAIDRCFLHDLSGPAALGMLQKSGRPARDPHRVFATPDHLILSAPGRTEEMSPLSARSMPLFRMGCKGYGLSLFDLDSPQQGIVHVVGPEQGLSLPGMTIVCGDSHTCTHGALGALAWGVGTSELYHVLATQTLMVKKPKTMYIELTGHLADEVGPMDVMLYLISTLGVDFGIGYAVEYGGELIREMEMEDRMTLCNLTVEMGSEYALISPDEKTFAYVKGRPYAPENEAWDAFEAHAAGLASNEESEFDKKVTIDVSGIGRFVSWGITPAHAAGVDACVPGTEGLEEARARSFNEAYQYMDIAPGTPLAGIRIDRVFIGSCSNGRLSNIRRVAEIVKGKHVADGVEAWVVPGSQPVRKAAEEEGLDTILKDAGFIWGEPSCSLCGGCNGEQVASGKRCVSTTNRNFIGRQGPGARTHLASPVTAAKAALSGKIE